MLKTFIQCSLFCIVALLLPSLASAKDNAKIAFDDQFYAQIDHAKSFKVAVKSKTKKHRAKKKRKKRYRKRLSRKQRRLARQRYVARLINQDHFNAAGPLSVASKKAIVVSQLTGEVIYSKNNRVVTPIASITKLMTAMVALDAQLPINDYLVIVKDDVDHLKNTRSRLRVGSALRREQLLQLALMSSENRAAAALSRNYPGGRTAFIRAMNTKAAMLGMQDTRFYDATGLDSRNVATANDLVKLVNAAHQYDEIRQITTTASSQVYANGTTRPLNYVNTNLFVRQTNDWHIGVSKTGFINEAGRCLVMQADLDGEPIIIVLLDSSGKYTRLGDANRVKKWYQYHRERKVTMLEGEQNSHITQ